MQPRDPFRTCKMLPGVVMFAMFLTSGCATFRPITGGKQVEVDIEQESYRIRITRSGADASRIEISSHGTVLWAKSVRNGGFYLGGESEEADEGGRITYLQPGADITGRGRPGFVITEWTDYPTRSYRDYIFEAGEVVRLAAVINSAANRLVYRATDDAAGCQILLWNSAVSPRSIVFQFTDGKCQVVPPAESTVLDLPRLAGELRPLFSQVAQEIPLRFHNAVLALRFAKDEQAAFELVEAAWPPERKGKREYLNWLRQTIVAEWRLLNPAGKSRSGNGRRLSERAHVFPAKRA